MALVIKREKHGLMEIMVHIGEYLESDTSKYEACYLTRTDYEDIMDALVRLDKIERIVKADKGFDYEKVMEIQGVLNGNR